MGTSDITPVLNLFIDWKSATTGLRPKVGFKSSPLSADALGTILMSIRLYLDELIQNRSIILDTYIYGGFTETDGRDSPEFILLSEALARVSWSGRSTRSAVRYRDLITVVSAKQNDPSTRIKALFRQGLRIPRPRLRIKGARCTCAWLTQTERWLASASSLHCPQCKNTRLSIERAGQKMVDTLLTAHLVHRAAVLKQDGELGEIWVFSDDSDVLPAVCTAAELGIDIVWLRSRPMRYGYGDIAHACGVTITEVTNA